MGYKYECGCEIERDYRTPLHETYLEGALSRINKYVSSYGINELLKRIRNINDNSLILQNETFVDYLQNGASVEDNKGGEFRDVPVQLIDFENPTANLFQIINQWTVDEYSKKAL